MDSCERCDVAIEGGYYCQTCGPIVAKRRERRELLEKIGEVLLFTLFALFILTTGILSIASLIGCIMVVVFNENPLWFVLGGVSCWFFGSLCEWASSGMKTIFS